MAKRSRAKAGSAASARRPNRKRPLLDPTVLLAASHPLGRVGALLFLQALEWQSMALDVYGRALRAGSMDASVEDQLRQGARVMLGAYLDLVKTTPEYRERLVLRQTEIVKAMGEALADLRERLGQPSKRTGGSRERQARHGR